MYRFLFLIIYGATAFRVASWNVAGLRAVLRKDPDALAALCKTHELDMLCLQETKLQESHLSDPKLKLPNGQLLQDVLKYAGYDAHWSCSTSKKGYSGTAVFVKQYSNTSSKKGGQQKSIQSFFQAKKATSKSSPKEEDGSSKEIESSSSSKLPINPDVLKPEQVVLQMGQDIDAEGRMVLLDFPFASIANVYVPNSGQVLERYVASSGENAAFIT
jgi:exonuclease III